MREVAILQNLDHPNIVRYLESYKNSKHLFLVMEFCPGGQIFDSIEDFVKEGKTYTEQQAAQTIKSCLEALAHCHSENIVHRDIKPENILYGSDGKVRLVDFGLACNSKQKLNEQAGTPYFMAPEVLNENYKGGSCDIWSLGCVLYMIATGKRPFDGTSRSEVSDLICRADYPAPDHISGACKDLISKMLTVDVSKRLTAQECLDHAWF